ncbi:unnamed protein product, partial [Urochloa humidicola]
GVAAVAEVPNRFIDLGFGPWCCCGATGLLHQLSLALLLDKCGGAALELNPIMELR